MKRDIHDALRSAIDAGDIPAMQGALMLVDGCVAEYCLSEPPDVIELLMQASGELQSNIAALAL